MRIDALLATAFDVTLVIGILIGAGLQRLDDRKGED